MLDGPVGGLPGPVLDETSAGRLLDLIDLVPHGPAKALLTVLVAANKTDSKKLYNARHIFCFPLVKCRSKAPLLR